MQEQGSVYAHALVAMPLYALYLAVAAAFVILFVIAYLAATRHDEIGLIRAGNTSAALALGGALMGFTLPLATAVAQASSLADLSLWAALALVVQLLAYGISNLVVPGLSGKIEQNALSAALVAATLSITCGLLSAAAMTA